MSESHTSPLASSAGSQEPFKNWKECQDALKKEPTPLEEERCLEFISRIRSSSDSKLIAYECLTWLGQGKEAVKFRWLEKPMTQLLGAGSEPPCLALLGNPGLVGKWVANELEPLKTLPAWKSFFGSGRHLWVLHCLFQCRDKRESLIEGLTELADGLALWQNLQSPKDWKNGGVQPMESRWIAKLLEGRLIPKYDLPKTFVEAVYAINAVAEVGASARSELKDVWRELDISRRERDEEASARRASETREGELVERLKNTQGDLERCSQSLASEKEHTTRTGGFSDVARRETVQQVLSTVRQGVLHRLEDIRVYADREKPNREEILELVKEIKDHFAKLETRLLS